MFLQIALGNKWKITLSTFVWLFPAVYFLMCRKIAWLRWCILTLATFEGFVFTVRPHVGLYFAHQRSWVPTLAAFVNFFFNTMCFPMNPESAGLKRWKITLLPFVSHLMNFHVFSQISCLSGWILTLVAFAVPCINMLFQMSSQGTCLNRSILTLVACVGFSPLCIIIWLLSWLGLVDVYVQWLHFFDTCPFCLFSCFFGLLSVEGTIITPCCLLIWLSRYLGCVNVWRHFLHKTFSPPACEIYNR